jgi:hypothetical protein
MVYPKLDDIKEGRKLKKMENLFVLWNFIMDLKEGKVKYIYIYIYVQGKLTRNMASYVE